VLMENQDLLVLRYINSLIIEIQNVHDICNNRTEIQVALAKFILRFFPQQKGLIFSKHFQNNT